MTKYRNANYISQYLLHVRYLVVFYPLFQTGTTELPAEEDSAIREYICMKAYLVGEIAKTFLHLMHMVTLTDYSVPTCIW